MQLFQDTYQLPFTSKLKAIKSGVLGESGDHLRWSAKCYMCAWICFSARFLQVFESPSPMHGLQYAFPTFPWLCPSCPSCFWALSFLEECGEGRPALQERPWPLATALWPCPAQPLSLWAGMTLFLPDSLSGLGLPVVCTSPHLISRFSCEGDGKHSVSLSSYWVEGLGL